MKSFLINTLKDFGIEVKIHRTVCGPVITRYELEPAKGVKVSKITSLADDLSLVLRATHIRVVAPIPGEAAVGIEVPNSQSLLVALREILEAEEWDKYKGRIPIALGKTIDGKLLLSDLSSLPHLLIAGATGSGKSVCINTIIMSLLYKFTPKELRLLLVDPKRVELMIYNDIPHLYSPIVNDAKYATVSLRKLVVEMENRYKQFAEINARDITAYNNKQSEGKMPYIIVVIDELADLMLVAAREVETSITRLAQLARGVGIHLILATQRPSVDVITGVIKANFPSRIAFQVASKVDSRTILDTNGADKLLGKGDMLFSPVSSPKPIRGQAAYVSTEETEKVVEFWRNQSLPLYILEKALEPKAQEVGTVEQEEDKKLIKEALLLIKERKRVSITSLQGYFKIGGLKATNLASELEMLGFIGPDQGSKPREIYLDKIEEKLKEL